MIISPNHAITEEAVSVTVSLSCILIEKGYVWHLNIYNCNSVQTSVFTTVWTVRNSLKHYKDWELAPMNCFKPLRFNFTICTRHWRCYLTLVGPIFVIDLRFWTNYFSLCLHTQSLLLNHIYYYSDLDSHIFIIYLW